MVIIRIKNRSPDMILTAFDGKFHETKDEIPPGACRPLKNICLKMSKKWTPKKLKKNNVEKVDPTKVEKKQCRKSGPPKSLKKQCRTGPDRF